MMSLLNGELVFGKNYRRSKRRGEKAPITGAKTAERLGRDRGERKKKLGEHCHQQIGSAIKQNGKKGPTNEFAKNTKEGKKKR